MSLIIAVKFCARNSRENVDQNLRNAVCSFELCTLFAGVIKDVKTYLKIGIKVNHLDPLKACDDDATFSFVEAAGDGGGRAENDDNVNFFSFYLLKYLLLIFRECKR